MDGGLRGTVYEYPITLEAHDETGRGYIRKEIKHQDELFDIIDDHIENNRGKKLQQVLLDLGIKDPINLIDDRTLKLLQLYNFYSSNTTPVPKFWDTQVWFDVVTLNEELKGAKWQKAITP